MTGLNYLLAAVVAIAVSSTVAVPLRHRDFTTEFQRMNVHSQPNDHGKGITYNGPPSYELYNYNPVANSSAVVVSGNARFTILTDRLIRMEYSSTGSFEDRPTLAFLNRNLPTPSYTHSTNQGVLNIRTAALNLTYVVGQEFGPNTLQVVSTDDSSAFKKWSYGMPNYGNLLGTIRSLDMLGVETLNCTLNANQTVHDESLHCEWGLISQDGWAVVNDTDNWGLTSGAEWWDGVNTDDEDLYLFAHGHDYVGALGDFVKVAGSIPMMPRYSTGIWFTRWYDLNNVDIKKYISDYVTRGLPLDVFILDMNWHTKYHWGGYTPDPHLFPYFNDTFDYMHNLGLHMAGNLHDDDGVHNTEDRFVDMCRVLGVDPYTVEQIPFTCLNKTHVYAIEDIILKNLPFDFWWIDWQQGGTEGGCAGGKQNPTILTDKVRVTSPKRQGKDTRGLVLARWGGLGTHRYQLGFSGDVIDLSWQNLAFQPYFSLTASNVAYGFWSHDIEGPADDLEMYVRWVQWAAYSAVFRSHDRGMSGGACADANTCSIVRPWNVPEKYYEPNKAAMLAREELIPYIYTAHRQAFETGISLLRPMYYYYPEQSMAYKADDVGNWAQYFFGDDIMAAPVVRKSDANTQMSKTSVWLPKGTWVEKDTGVLRVVDDDNGSILTKSYDISEIPVFVRGGAIIPGIPIDLGNTIGLAKQQYTTLVLTIYPGASQGSTKVYEDDGMTTSYLDGKYVWTTVSYTRTATSIDISISSSGSYSEFPSQRQYVIVLVNNMPIRSATVNGQTLKSARFGGENSYTFDGNDMKAIIATPSVSTSGTTTISASFDAVDDNTMSGLAGAIKHATIAKRNLDETRTTPGAHDPNGGNLMSLSSSGDELSYLAHANINAVPWKIAQLPALYQAALSELVNGSKPDPSQSPDNTLVQMFLAADNDHVLCGTLNCLTENSYYSQVRYEGYMPMANTPFTTPLFLYWNNEQSAQKDNLVTTDPNPPSGYVLGDYQNNGQVFTRSDAADGLVPLQLWYKESINDHMTLASQESESYAKQNGYTLVNGTLGYVYSADPYHRPGVLKGPISDARMTYSISLLENVFN